MNIIKKIFELYYDKTNGFYPFFKYCPQKYKKYFFNKKFKSVLNYDMNFDNCSTFNEKIRWLIYNEKLDLKSKLTDKIYVKEYYRQITNDNNYSKILGVWDKFQDIEYDKLPDSFALKTNHGWKMNIFVKNKRSLIKERAKYKKIFDNWMNINFYDFSLEPQYKDIKRKIYAEEYQQPGKTIEECLEYQIHCFNGEPEYIEVITDMSAYKLFNIKYFSLFYDLNWNLQDFCCVQSADYKFKAPKYLNKMINYARKLSKEFSYVRIDFSNYNDNFIFREMTFSPFGTIMNIVPKEYDQILGNKIKLPDNAEPAEIKYL